MPETTNQPKYRKQKRAGRTDLAFVVIAGRRHYLGDWDSDESREQYARLLAEWKASQSSPIRAKNVHVMSLIVAYWKHVHAYHGDVSPEIYHHRSALRIVKGLYGRVFNSDLPLTCLDTRSRVVLRFGVLDFDVLPSV